MQFHFGIRGGPLLSFQGLLMWRVDVERCCLDCERARFLLLLIHSIIVHCFLMHIRQNNVAQ